MQFLRAGEQQLILLELDRDVIGGLVRQAGFDCNMEDEGRQLVLELTPLNKDPLLLFDASDPANLGWFSRCQFYVDGRTRCQNEGCTREDRLKGSGGKLFN